MTDIAVEPDNLQKHISAAESFAGGHDGTAPDWMRALRRDGRDAFARLGWPTRRVEDWRFTDVTEIARGRFLPSAGPRTGASVADALKALPYLSDGCACLVIVDGVVDVESSIWPEAGSGIELLSLAEYVPGGGGVLPGSIARADSSAFSALNAAFLRDGAVVRIAADAELERPVHLVFVSAESGALAAPRNMVIAEDGANAAVVESYISIAGAAHLTNTVTEISVAPGASLDYYKIQRESRHSFHVGLTEVTQAATSVFSKSTFNLGGALVRNDVNVTLAGERCHATLNGLTLVSGKQHVDNHTSIDHASPNCESHELYKAILAGRSRSVFNGKIFVRPGAQKTDAKQTNRNLLLSNQATADTKPQLEIFADDVKCTHGATVGQLSDEEIFYLRSRGMSEEAARRMLTYGFANDIVERVKPEAIRLALHDMQAAALGSTADIGE